MASKPMTTADVSRLLGRVAFGATAEDVDRWTGKPYDDLVDELLAVADLPVVPPLPDDSQRPLIERASAPPEDAQRWWLERMRTTPYPLLERMTLLWHGHFATAVRNPPSMAEMVWQNSTLRTHALGNVRELLGAMTVDPAMLLWLDGHLNAVPQPNENYARELFELFTLGTRPQVYTERDVREAARALTGWIVTSGTLVRFVPERHDPGTKRVLGRTIENLGDEEYLAVVDAALAKPVASRFLAEKLVANLAYVLVPGDPLVERVAAELRKEWSIADALRLLLRADAFRYAAASRGRQLVRTPVEAVVHAAKALGVAFDDNTLVWQLERMGHAVFEPIDVSGWPLGEDWITPVSAIARYDAGLALWHKAKEVTARDLAPLPEAGDLKGWAHLLGLPGFSRNTTHAIGAYLRRTPKAGDEPHQAGVLALILSSPEWVVM